MFRLTISILVLWKGIHYEGEYFAFATMWQAVAVTKLLFDISDREPRSGDVGRLSPQWNQAFRHVSHFSAVSPSSLLNPLTVSLSVSDAVLATTINGENLDFFQNETQDSTLSSRSTCPDSKSKGLSYTTLIYYVLPTALALLSIIIFIVIFVYEKSFPKEKMI